MLPFPSVLRDIMGIYDMTVFRYEKAPLSLVLQSLQGGTSSNTERILGLRWGPGSLVLALMFSDFILWATLWQRLAAGEALPKSTRSLLHTPKESLSCILRKTLQTGSWAYGGREKKRLERQPRRGYRFCSLRHPLCMLLVNRTYCEC